MTQMQEMIRPEVAPVLREECRVEALRLGRWELTALAAEGSFSRIYRARPILSSRDQASNYALKTLRPEWADDPHAARLLACELEVGRKISHPHLAPILSGGTARKTPYVVMPWLEGADLRRCLERRRTLDVPAALWIARQIAEALAALHQVGWTHNDVKPSNVLVSREGHATLLDLSFARRMDAEDAATDRCVMGTFGYIAPEALTSTQRIDARSDIYSLGATLYHMLCGRAPFEGTAVEDLAEAHLHSAPPDVREFAPHLSLSASRFVHRLLAKDPIRRPQSADELIAELIRLEIETFSERN